MSEARLFYNHVVDSLPNQHDRDAIRTYVAELEQRIIDVEADGVTLQADVEFYYDRSVNLQQQNKNIQFGRSQILNPKLGKIKEPQTMKSKLCKWKYDDMHNYYDTECGEGFCFIEGRVKDNKYNYCPYCGRQIKEGEIDGI